MNFLQVIAAATLALPTSAFAVSFDLTKRAPFHSTYGNDFYATSRYFSAGGINLSATAFSGGYSNGHYEESYGRTGHDVKHDWVSRSGNGGGLGVGIDKSPIASSALDNHGLVSDMLLLSFDQAVSLDFADINWSYNDSDMTILAYTGKDATPHSAGHMLIGKKWDDALAQDWDGGHFFNVARQGNTVAANPKDLTAFSWLVGGHMRELDNIEVLSNNQYRDNLFDFVRVSSIDVSLAHSVPEIDANQSGIAFGFLLTLMAYIRERRRKQAVNKAA